MTRLLAAMALCLLIVVGVVIVGRRSPREADCAECGGTGWWPAQVFNGVEIPPTPCPMCGGEGKLIVER